MVILMNDDNSLNRKLERYVKENYSMGVERVVHSDELGNVLKSSSHEWHDLFVAQKGNNYYDIVVTHFKMRMEA